MKVGETGGCGCVGLVVGGLVGGWALQYDLGRWLPVLHQMFPDAIHDPGPIKIFPWLFLAGWILGWPAIVVALVTMLLTVLGII